VGGETEDKTDRAEMNLAIRPYRLSDAEPVYAAIMESFRRNGLLHRSGDRPPAF
jgi:hypothetical protein